MNCDTAAFMQANVAPIMPAYGHISTAIANGNYNMVFENLFQHSHLINLLDAKCFDHGENKRVPLRIPTLGNQRWIRGGNKIKNFMPTRSMGSTCVSALSYGSGRPKGD